MASWLQRLAERGRSVVDEFRARVDRFLIGAIPQVDETPIIDESIELSDDDFERLVQQDDPDDERYQPEVVDPDVESDLSDLDYDSDRIQVVDRMTEYLYDNRDKRQRFGSLVEAIEYADPIPVPTVVTLGNDGLYVVIIDYEAIETDQL